MLLQKWNGILLTYIQYCQFWFAGPLTKSTEAQKCKYLMIWIGDKGKDIYSTWNISEEDGKKN